MVAGLTGCATLAWYGQAARGQLEVLAKREDIAELINDPETPEDLRERLVTVLDMRRFAVDELGLPEGRSYTLYADLGREAPLWNVVATPAYSVQPMTWCYPLVGCLSYRGFFQRERAFDLAGELADEGLDSAVFAATAYSTLGWFADPVLDSMLELPDAALAELIFHELSHELVYVRGATAFNEAYATFVGRLGAERWLRSRGRIDELHQRQHSLALSQALNERLLETRQRLATGFAERDSESELAEFKAAEFGRLRAAIEALAAEQETTRLDGWLARPLNNAHLALVATYEAGTTAFERLYREPCGEELACVHAEVERLAAAGSDVRQNFLSGGH